MRGWPTAPSTASPPTTRRTRTRTRTASGRRPRSGMLGLETALSSCSTRWSTPACSTGPASPTGCRTRRRGSAGSPTTAGRSRRGAGERRARRPRRDAGSSSRPDSASLSRNTPVRRHGAARPRGRDVPARRGRPCSTGSCSDSPVSDRRRWAGAILAWLLVCGASYARMLAGGWRRHRGRRRRVARASARPESGRCARRTRLVTRRRRHRRDRRRLERVRYWPGPAPRS